MIVLNIFQAGCNYADFPKYQQAHCPVRGSSRVLDSDESIMNKISVDLWMRQYDKMYIPDDCCYMRRKNIPHVPSQVWSHPS